MRVWQGAFVSAGRASRVQQYLSVIPLLTTGSLPATPPSGSCVTASPADLDLPLGPPPRNYRNPPHLYMQLQRHSLRLRSDWQWQDLYHPWCVNTPCLLSSQRRVRWCSTQSTLASKLRIAHTTLRHSPLTFLSYTNAGPESAGASQRGLLPRTLDYVFTRMREAEAKSGGTLSYACKASFLEVRVCMWETC